MDKYYSSERNVQMLVTLMKAHGVKKVVASPGTTNINLVWSLQQDPYFEIYSSVDERSAAYIACGLAAESGEPVALSCTGATASRNYVPGLTEAFYRHLPVLAITATQHPGRVGNYVPQVIDRTVQLKDTVKFSAQVMMPYTEEDEWDCNVAINKALIELRRKGGGPVHINLMTTYSQDFSVKDLPPTRVIRHYTYSSELPELKNGRVAVYVGAHVRWDQTLTEKVETFCAAYNAVVICDHTSNYRGKYCVEPSIVCSQLNYVSPYRYVDTLIHIGYVTGASMSMRPTRVWRVNPDGEIRDTFRKLTAVFEMEEEDFFSAYVERASDHEGEDTYLEQWKEECEKLYRKIPELPFSNAWIAQQTGHRLPDGSVLHLGILNSLRTWNFFPINKSIDCYSNTGGFGIDGLISSLLGAALAHPNQLHFGILGDLAFFYDMNVLGNRHFTSNVRILMINNGRGTEFRNYNHLAARFGEDADAYMAAAGHFGQKSFNLVRHYAQDLEFEYLSAENKSEYIEKLPRFLDDELTDRPMLFEVFTDSKDESEVLEIVYNLESDTKGATKKLVKDVLGDKGITVLKSIIKR